MATKDIPDVIVLDAYVESAVTRTKWPEQILHERTGQPLKVCLSAMERADRHGLIDYGVSLRSGWLTPDGEALYRMWRDECMAIVARGIESLVIRTSI